MVAPTQASCRYLPMRVLCDARYQICYWRTTLLYCVMRCTGGTHAQRTGSDIAYQSVYQMRCVVLAPRMVLGQCYAMRGTDVGMVLPGERSAVHYRRV